jgi:VCBS repeat protein/NHL repeat-containing protein
MTAKSGVSAGLVALLVVGSVPVAYAAGPGVSSIVTRVAGQSGLHGYGGDGGPAVDALLNGSGAIEFDALGNLYIGDVTRVRKVTAATGIISTVAGNGSFSYSGDGGPATAAGLGNVSGLAVDAEGNLYVVGSFVHRVRKITAATGIITTIAGNGVEAFGGDGGPAINAQLASPSGIAVDRSGNVYIADTHNNRVRKITAATGIITTVAGSGHTGCCQGPSGDGGPALQATTMPYHVAVDGAGNFYFSEPWPNSVRKVSVATGIITTVAGGRETGDDGDGGPATAAGTEGVSALALDRAGNLYIGNSVGDAGRARRVDAATGMISTVAGRFDGGVTGDGGPALDAEFGGITGLAFDGADTLYLSDDSRVRKLAPNPHDVPLVGDMDGDGKADLIVWRPATGTWFWLTSSTGYDYVAARSVQWGNRDLGDVPFLGDIDGDGKADPIVWRASTGTWYWLTSWSGYRAGVSKQWGNVDLGDIPLLADMDGDRRPDLIVWRASTGTWYWLTSSSQYNYAFGRAKQWGSARLSDMPLVGDVDGDGKGDLVVWRKRDANTGTWMWTTSGSRYTDGLGTSWGDFRRGDVHLLADMDGDGRADLVIWSRDTGTWSWLTAFGGFNVLAERRRQWGSQELLDRAVLGDFDGDGKAEPVVWRLSTGTWFWLTSSGGYYDSSGHQKQWGT